MGWAEWVRSHGLLVVADAFLGMCAVWQALAIFCAYSGLSFDTLYGLGFLSVLGALLPLATKPWVADVPVLVLPEVLKGSEEPIAPKWVIGLAIGVAAGGAIAAERRLLGFEWASLLMLPLCIVFAGPTAGRPRVQDLRASWADWAGVAVAALAAVLITAYTTRPDVDDGYYLNEVIVTLQHPSWPVLGFDGIHGVVGAPLQQPIHRPQTYEVLVAWIARTLGMGPREAYWVWVPLIWAALGGLAHWCMAKALVPRHAWLAAPLTTLALATWLDGAQAMGRFAYPRLFQGKSVFATVLVPLVVFSAWRYVVNPSKRSFLRLMMAQLGATLFTSTALVVVPIAAGLAVLAGFWPDRRSVIATVMGWVSSGPVLLILGLMMVELTQAGGLKAEGHEMAISAALGVHRGELAMLALAAAPWMLGGRAPWLSRYAMSCFVLLFSGIGPSILGESGAELLNWRTVWAVPLSVILGVVVAEGLVMAPTLAKDFGLSKLVKFSLACVLLLGFVGESKQRRNSDIRYGWLELKVKPGDERIANAVMKRATVDDVVAAPPLIAQSLAMLEERPKLAGVWLRYVSNLTRFWGEAESEARMDLLSFARGKSPTVPAAELQQICVTVVVTPKKYRTIPEVTTGLQALGFEAETVEPYEIWTRDAGWCDLPVPEGAPKAAKAPNGSKGKKSRKGARNLGPTPDEEDTGEAP